MHPRPRCRPEEVLGVWSRPITAELISADA
jgi:hypothetical protein